MVTLKFGESFKIFAPSVLTSINCIAILMTSCAIGYQVVLSMYARGFALTDQFRPVAVCGRQLPKW